MVIRIGIGIENYKNQGGGGGVAPSNSVAPAISAPYYIAGQTITTTDGTWSGTPTITFSYQWQVSADGLTGWSNVGTNSNSILISSGAQQLLFYRCVVTASNGVGSPVSANSNVAGGVDSEAQTHFNRVTTDSGVMTYGLIGVDTYIKTTKFFYNITTLSTKFTALRNLDILGYKAGSGSGVTAGRAVQRVYSALGASGDYIQNTTTAQPALSAWSVGQNYLGTFGSNGNGAWSSNKANPNNTKATIIVQLRKMQTGQNNNILTYGDNLGFNFEMLLLASGSNYIARLTLADSSNFNATTTIAGTFDGFLRCIVTTSGSDLLIDWATSTDGVTYTALGTQVTATGKAGQIGSTSRSFRVAAKSNFHSGIPCEYLSAQYFDGNDTLLFNFQPNQYNRVANQTGWTSNTGETWTLNVASAATGLKAMIVDQTMIQGNGTTMGMQAASLSMDTSVFTQYNVWRKYSNVITAGAYGMLNEFGVNVATNQGIAFIPNEAANTESLYTTANGGLNGTSWQSNSTALKVSIFEGDVNGSPYEQALRTNNVANTINAVQAVSNNTTNIVSTAQNLLARNNAASLWLNAIWVGDAMTNTTDTPTERANFYNLLATESNII